MLYADDIVLISTTENGLQKSLDKLNAYCKEWDLDVNMDKTKVVVFNKPGKIVPTKLSYNGKILESKAVYKYLGVLLSNNGKLSKAKTDLSQRGQKAIFKMKTSFKGASPNFETCMHLFDHIIKPNLLYASDVWGYTAIKNGHLELNSLNRDDIENCHLKFCRFALGVSKRAPNIGIYGEIGRFPLAIEAVLNSVKFWHRVQNMSNSSLLQKAYNEMVNLNLDNSWYTSMKSLLTKAGTIHNNPSLVTVINGIKPILEGQYLQFWRNKLFDDKNKANGNKLRSYRTYKNMFGKEEYLKLQSKNLRGDFARLRLSAHKLHIETGRYANKTDRKEPHDRICTYCTTNLCEDEFHFIMKCPLYNDYRNELFNYICVKFPFFSDYDQLNQFNWLMSNLDFDIITTFTKFVNRCFTKRRSSSTIHN